MLDRGDAGPGRRPRPARPLRRIPGRGAAGRRRRQLLPVLRRAAPAARRLGRRSSADDDGGGHGHAADAAHLRADAGLGPRRRPPHPPGAAHRGATSAPSSTAPPTSPSCSTRTSRSRGPPARGRAPRPGRPATWRGAGCRTSCTPRTGTSCSARWTRRPVSWTAAVRCSGCGPATVAGGSSRRSGRRRGGAARRIRSREPRRARPAPARRRRAPEHRDRARAHGLHRLPDRPAQPRALHGGRSRPPSAARRRRARRVLLIDLDGFKAVNDVARPRRRRPLLCEVAAGCARRRGTATCWPGSVATSSPCSCPAPPTRPRDSPSGSSSCCTAPSAPRPRTARGGVSPSPSPAASGSPSCSRATTRRTAIRACGPRAARAPRPPARTASLLGAGHRQRHRPPDPAGPRPPRGARAGPAATGVPADHRHDRPSRARPRGARPLGPPAPRDDPPGGVHLAGRGGRADRAAAAVGPPDRDRRGAELLAEGWQLQMAVNVSVRHLQARCLAPDVAHALAAPACRREKLVLEITESVMLDAEDRLERDLGTLRDMGSGSRWTTSAPATPRSPASPGCRST